MKPIIAAAAACLMTANVASADMMYYGIGAVTCGKILNENWMNNGAFSWVQGYMSGVEVLVPGETADILPGGSPKDLARLVLLQCRHDPSKMLGEAASEISFRLVKKQVKGGNKQDFE